MPSITKVCVVIGCYKPVKYYRHCDEHFVILRAHRGKSAEYRAWRAMKTRCYNPNAQNYKFYGASGVKVCEEWRLSFVNFFLNMGYKPTSEHSLDRIDSVRDYEPNNCEWATKYKQARNRKLPHSNKSGFRGVSLFKGKWRASIRAYSKYIYLGSYANKVEAAKAYNHAALKYFGKDAKLNSFLNDKIA